MEQKINTFLVGAQKAGTTSLYNWIGQHPDIFAPEEIKDYHYFTRESLYKKGIEHFHSFYKKRNEKILVHAGVQYLFFSEIAAKRLYKYNSNAKIIITIRNPIDRAISSYNYACRKGIEKDTFASAIQKEMQGDIKGYINKANFSYIEHGYYYKQLSNFLKFFPVENIKIVCFEDLTNKKTRQIIINDIFSFLNITLNFEVKYNHLNVSGSSRSNIVNKILWGSKMKNIINVVFPYRKMFSFKTRRKIFQQISMLNTNHKPNKKTYDLKIKRMLEKKYKNDILLLSKFLNINLIKKWKMYE